MDVFRELSDPTRNISHLSYSKLESPQQSPTHGTMSLVYQGLWNVETHLMAFGLQGFGTFISIFNFLVFAVLACSTAFSISTRSQHWKDVWPLQVGLGLLSG